MGARRIRPWMQLSRRTAEAVQVYGNGRGMRKAACYTVARLLCVLVGRLTNADHINFVSSLLFYSMPPKNLLTFRQGDEENAIVGPYKDVGGDHVHQGIHDKNVGDPSNNCAIQ